MWKDLLKRFLPNRLQCYIISKLDQIGMVHKTAIPETTPIHHFHPSDIGGVEKIIESQSGLKLSVMHLYPDTPEDAPVYVGDHGVKGHWFECTREANQAPFNTGYRANALETIRDNGGHVIALSAPGFGNSEGQASSAAYEEGAEAFAKYLVEEVGISEDNTILFGESMGSYKILALAEALSKNYDFHPKRIVLIAAFGSVEKLAQQEFPHFTQEEFAPCWHEDVSNIKKLDALHSAKTKLHFVTFDQDKTVPNEHTLELINAAKEKGFTVTHQALRGEHVGWDMNPILEEVKQLDKREAPSSKKHTTSEEKDAKPSWRERTRAYSKAPGKWQDLAAPSKGSALENSSVCLLPERFSADTDTSPFPSTISSAAQGHDPAGNVALGMVALYAGKKLLQHAKESCTIV